MSLDLAREQFQDHSNTREKILNQCFRCLLKAGLSFDAATSGESIRRGKICTKKQSFRSLPPLPFIFLSPLLSSCLALPFFFFSLLTTVIVSFSLSKNIVFLPRCKGGKISTRVLPFHLRGGERNLEGNQVS